MKVAVWHSDGNNRWLGGVFDTQLSLEDFAEQYVKQNIVSSEDWEEDGDEETIFYIHYNPCQCEECLDPERLEEEEHEGYWEHIEFTTLIPAQPHTVLPWHDGDYGRTNKG